jgi:hypothetical protein
MEEDEAIKSGIKTIFIIIFTENALFLLNFLRKYRFYISICSNIKIGEYVIFFNEMEKIMNKFIKIVVVAAVFALQCGALLAGTIGGRCTADKDCAGLGATVHCTAGKCQ